MSAADWPSSPVGSGDHDPTTLPAEARQVWYAGHALLRQLVADGPLYPYAKLAYVEELEKALTELRARLEEDTQPVAADADEDDYWSPEPMSQASAEFMARQPGERDDEPGSPEWHSLHHTGTGQHHECDFDVCVDWSARRVPTVQGGAR